MKRIPDAKIKRLEESFKAVRKNGIKLLLCFRYEASSSDKKGPTVDIILSHIKQLKPILQRNMDIIAVFQTGFVGLYGEWRRSYHKIEKDPIAQKKIILALLDVIPPDRKMVMRYPWYKNIFIKALNNSEHWEPMKYNVAHTMRPEARIGICDHGFMVGKSDAGTFAIPSKGYDYVTQESLFVPMEGELFWSHSDPYGRAKDDGLVAIKRLWEHHYTLFSYAHNHSRYEGWTWKKKYGARYSIDEWKKEEVKPEFLKNNNLPISDSYFENAKGQYVSRSIFEYIRDHLGYRIELKSSSYPSSASPGKQFKALIKLANRGFAAPVNPRPVYMVLVGKDKVYKISKARTDVRRWYPCKPLKRTVVSPVYTINFKTNSFPKVPVGNYKLGIWMPDYYRSLQSDARYAIKLANRDVPWWPGEKNNYGINIIGNISVK